MKVVRLYGVTSFILRCQSLNECSEHNACRSKNISTAETRHNALYC